MTDSHSHEVIVVGGGPAGSAAATLLARHTHKVLLLEREKFPRFRIGESLMPATYWTLQRMGVLQELEAGGFVRKASVQFFVASGKAARPFYFSEVDSDDSAVTFQVDRAGFDQILLQHAAASGVEVRQEVGVSEVLFDGERATGVVATLADGSRQELAARVVVDATGQNALISRRLGLKQEDTRLRNCAFFTRYSGAVRDSGIDAGATLILHTDSSDSWFWYIPLAGDVVSVGVVGHIDHLVKGRPGTPQEVFDQELAICPALQPRLKPARQLEGVQVLRDFSYSSTRIAGPGWVLAGDAFGFLDPIYSSGVFMALKSGEMAADSIHAALAAGDLSAAALGRHGDELLQGMEGMRRLIYAFYDKSFSFARFLKQHPECRTDLVNLLVGNIFRKDCTGIFGPMNEFSPVEDYEPLGFTAEKV